MSGQREREGGRKRQIIDVLYTHCTAYTILLCAFACVYIVHAIPSTCPNTLNESIFLSSVRCNTQATLWCLFYVYCDTKRNLSHLLHFTLLFHTTHGSRNFSSHSFHRYQLFTCKYQDAKSAGVWESRKRSESKHEQNRASEMKCNLQK